MSAGLSRGWRPRVVADVVRVAEHVRDRFHGAPWSFQNPYILEEVVTPASQLLEEYGLGYSRRI
jgi:hypothetical protein